MKSPRTDGTGITAAGTRRYDDVLGLGRVEGEEDLGVAELEPGPGDEDSEDGPAQHDDQTPTEGGEVAKYLTKTSNAQRSQ